MASGMPADLIATKLTAPRPPANLVDRGRLTARLDHAAADPNQRLILVSAPAGSGKSTLVASWLAERAEAAAWLQIEPSDADPARFWAYLVAALAGTNPELATEADQAISAAAADPEPLIALVVNTLSRADRPGIVVLDDYHAINSEAVDQGLGRLIELAPPSQTFVVCTRLDPAIRLARLRVRNELVEIRVDDLRFDEGEAAPLLGPTSNGLSPDQLTSLCQRTEGWAAGLVLAGMSLTDHPDPERFVASFQGDDRLVVDYLTEEFLAGLGDADRRRLLRTSILDRMTGPLIDAVCQTDDGGAWLRHLGATNQLLIGLDRTGTWYRYHHLLGDLLRLEAGDDAVGVGVAGELSELHLRAGAWHAEHGDADRAVEHYLSGGDLDTAATLIWDHATDLLNRGQLQTVRAQIDRLGPLADEHVGSLLMRGWIAQLSGRFDEAGRCLAEARRREPNESEFGQIVALGIVHHLSRGDLASALAVAEGSPGSREATQTSALGIVRVWAGRFDEARPFLERAEEQAEAEAHTFATVSTRVHQAVVELESGNPAEARRWAELALTFASDRRFDNVSHLGLAHIIAARTADGGEDGDEDEGDDDGNTDGPVVAALRGVTLLRRSPGRVTLGYALAVAGDILSSTGHADGPALLTEARALIDRCVDPGLAGTVLARVEARHGRAAPVPQAGLVEELTERELAVLRFLPSGLSQRDIASELFVSLNTVKTHCRAIYRKLGVGDRRAAVQTARDAGLL